MRYRIPDENAPGFIRRERKRMAFLQADGADKVDAMIEWLKDFVLDEDPVAALEEASEVEISELITALSGVGVPDPKASEPSEDG